MYSDCVFVREEGELRCVDAGFGWTGRGVRLSRCASAAPPLFSKHPGPSAQTEHRSNDHFTSSCDSDGRRRYSAKRLFDISLLFIADNIEHVDSLVGFPEQMADGLFRAAEQKHKFSESGCSVRALQVFSEAYGELLLHSLCLRDRCLLLSERMEEIRVFNSLQTLDLHGCRLGDSHEFFTYITSEACSRLVHLFLGQTGLSDKGLQGLTAPIRVMKRGLENLQYLDLSRNPLTEKGLRYLTCFHKLEELNISDTNVKLNTSVKKFLQSEMALILSPVPLQTFTHSQCETVGWVKEVINQWEIKAAQLPQKVPKPKTNALQFYGREKFVRENVKPWCSDDKSKEMTVAHFHKVQCDVTSQRGSQTSSKRKFSTEEQLDKDQSPAKRPKAACDPSPEDLELLNMY